MSKSPTQRTLEALRKEGWTADIVERWIQGAKIRKDFLGIIDIIAMKGPVTLAIQATSDSNVSARVKKIKESDALQAVSEAKWRLEVWGWHQKGRFWEARTVDLLEKAGDCDLCGEWAGNLENGACGPCNKMFHVEPT